MRLFYVEDRSYKGVADSLGMPLGTVKNSAPGTQEARRARAPGGGKAA